MPKLEQLLEGISVVSNPVPLETEISSIAYDSRKIEPGNIFVACKGKKDEGKNYIPQALEKGALAIVIDETIDSNEVITSLPLVIVPDSRLALAQLAANFYEHPSEDFLLIGVTGTNGKTTITYLLENVLLSLEKKVGLLGTINYRFRGETFPGTLTTPEATDLQRIFSEMKKKNGEIVIMEVSSHSLAQKRTVGGYFDLAIFTNLTPEHLDFHETMEEYFLAKTKLFTGINPEIKKNFPKFAIINLDSPWGEKLLPLVKIPVLTYGIKKKADFQAKEIKLTDEGSHFLLATAQGEYPLNCTLLGKFNIYNILAAFVALYSLRIEPEKIIPLLEKVSHIPGRLEPVDCGQPFTVLIDYAHTEDALANVLSTLREMSKGKIITVFGCGGDRDRSKRPKMGEIAVRLSDFVIVTSDNPRGEEPERIALDIEVGIRRIEKNNYKVILDRREAIREAISLARENDLVLLAGKGHENYQIFADKTIPFNDREIAEEIIREVYITKK